MRHIPSVKLKGPTSSKFGHFQLDKKYRTGVDQAHDNTKIRDRIAAEKSATFHFQFNTSKFKSYFTSVSQLQTVSRYKMPVSLHSSSQPSIHLLPCFHFECYLFRNLYSIFSNTKSKQTRDDAQMQMRTFLHNASQTSIKFHHYTQQ